MVLPREKFVDHSAMRIRRQPKRVTGGGRGFGWFRDWT